MNKPANLIGEKIYKKLLGKNIAKYRRFHELSQKQLGEAIGISETTISLWEIGETDPKSYNLAAIAFILNETIDTLSPSLKVD